MNRKLQIRKVLTGCSVLLLTLFVPGVKALASFDKEVEQAYNMAVQGQDALDGLDVTVNEQTVSSATNIMSTRDVELAVTGIREEDLSAVIRVTTGEGSSEEYYKDGYYYKQAGDEQIRTEMDRQTLWKLINSEIYLDMTSNYLKLLYSTEGKDGSVTYWFAATEESLGDYKDKLLDAYSSEFGTAIISMQGSMKVDKDGHVLERDTSIVYEAGTGDDQNPEVFHKMVKADFHQEDRVEVDLPKLNEYDDADDEKPAVTITPLVRTVYVTDDVNVRAAGSLDAAVIGGYSRGSGVSQTGYTSDGWIQIQYNNGTGFIWGEYISATKPVYVKDSSGIMYATTDVNIRDTYSTEGAILGTLRKGESIEVTGTTDNGWTRVKYNGGKAYVSSNYLSRSEPVADTYVKSGTVSGTVVDYTYGSLTIRRDDGGTTLFNTQYAALDIVDSIEIGDWVTVTYTGAGSPYTATAVMDYASHAYQATRNLYTVDGVVTSVYGNHMELSGSDGVFRSFDLSQASIETDERLSPGDYVFVSWYSYTGAETDDIVAVAVA